MQSLQQKASEWSGVPTNEAFSIDETNLFLKLGLQTFINLSTNFYNRFQFSTIIQFCKCIIITAKTIIHLFYICFGRVYDDEEEWFRSIFANSKKEEAIQNQYEFFVQRMGGPPLFSQRRGIFYFILLFDHTFAF